jgi:hypothetical protein
MTYRHTHRQTHILNSPSLRKTKTLRSAFGLTPLNQMINSYYPIIYHKVGLKNTVASPNWSYSNKKLDAHGKPLPLCIGRQCGAPNTSCCLSFSHELLEPGSGPLLEEVEQGREQPRLVFLEGLGTANLADWSFTLIGGNQSGVFADEVRDGERAGRAGLGSGDRILEVS